MPRSLRAPFLSIASRKPRPTRHAFHCDFVLGTSLELQVSADGRRSARRAEAAVLAEVDRLEAILSGWSSTSELARWSMTYDVDVPVSNELADVLVAADRWRARTGGAFDPAAGAIITLLRDGAGDRPADEALRALLDSLRGPRWSVDRAESTARRLTRHAISLDAIAKGYIVANAAARGHEVNGITDVLLNIGGDVQHLGGQPVAVGVADPFAPADNAPPIDVVRLQDAALATSGGYRRGFMLHGRRVSHILDPRTGRPAERIASASVLAPDCATADALSTAFSVMEPHESVALADLLPGVGCLLVATDGTISANGTWNAHATTSRNDTTHARF
jgi:thiamine biosynthesis lipoprotein